MSSVTAEPSLFATPGGCRPPEAGLSVAVARSLGEELQSRIGGVRVDVEDLGGHDAMGHERVGNDPGPDLLARYAGGEDRSAEARPDAAHEHEDPSSTPAVTHSWCPARCSEA